MPIQINKKHKSAVTLDTTSNTYSLADFAKDSETVNGLAINKVWFSSNGTWTIARGSNTVAVLVGTNSFDFVGHGCPIVKDETGTLVLTLSASSVGSIMVEVRKTDAATDYV